MSGHNLLVKIHLLRHKESRLEKLSRAMDKYGKASDYFKSHKMVICNVVIISIIQRFLLFFVTYLVYCSLNLRGESGADIVLLQAMISVAVDMLPLPGGVGASESLFVTIFQPIFGSYIYSGLLLSRGISYYALLLISAAVTIYTHITVTRKTARRCSMREGV